MIFIRFMRIVSSFYEDCFFVFRGLFLRFMRIVALISSYRFMSSLLVVSSDVLNVYCNLDQLGRSQVELKEHMSPHAL